MKKKQDKVITTKTKKKDNTKQQEFSFIPIEKTKTSKVIPT